MKSDLQIFLDGELVPAGEAKISVYDHGFLYGDGVFEGLRVYNRRIFRHEEHIERLYRSAKAIWLEPPYSREEFKRHTEQTVIANRIENGYIRAIFSRGVGDLGLDPRKCPKPTTIIIADTIQVHPPEVYERGIECITAATRRNRADVLNPAIKSLNYLNNVLAKIETIKAGVSSCIMLNDQGLVTEGNVENLFIVHEGYNGDIELQTPPVSAGILEGITRFSVMELAEKLGFRVVEKNLALYDLYNAKEAFLTGSGAEIVPMTTLDMRKIGDGQPGEMTKALIAAYKELTASEGEPLF